VAVLRSSDRYGRFGIKEFRDAARRLQRPLAIEVLFEPGNDDFGAEVERIVASEVEAVVLWASARDAARIVQQARDHGLDVPIFGTDRLVSDEFLERAGADAEGIEATTWMLPGRTDRAWVEFAARYRQRYGADPDTWAAYAYDAAVLTIGAIRTAGLNHARIMDALGGIERYQGVAGPMSFDATWNNIAAPLMVRVVNGRFVGADEDDSVARLVAPASAEPLRVGLLSEGGGDDDPFLQGARRAAAAINDVGGVDGRPLEILALEAGSPWRDGASRIARLSATDGLVALIGGADGATAHVAAQVATRRRIPYLSSSPEESLTRAGDRWVLRAVPSDADQAEAMLRAAFERPATARVAAVVPEGREGRERLAALREACGRTGTTLSTTTSAPVPADADAVLLWLDPAPAIEWLARVAASEGQPILGSIRLDEPELQRAATRGSHRLLLPMLTPAEGGAPISASERSLAARLGHDLVQLVAEAALGADDEPDQLLSRLLATPALSGRTGRLSFDARGNRIAEFTILELPPPGAASPGETP